MDIKGTHLECDNGQQLDTLLDWVMFTENNYLSLWSSGPALEGPST